MRSMPWVDDVLRDRVPFGTRWVLADEVLELCAALEISELVHHRVARARTTSDWPTEARRELERRTRSSMARELVRAAKSRRCSRGSGGTPGVSNHSQRSGSRSH